MLVWMAVNQELAVGPSLQRSTTVCWPSGEWSSNSLNKENVRTVSENIFLKHAIIYMVAHCKPPLALSISYYYQKKESYGLF